MAELEGDCAVWLPARALTTKVFELNSEIRRLRCEELAGLRRRLEERLRTPMMAVELVNRLKLKRSHTVGLE
jgi:hypothetical protein